MTAVWDAVSWFFSAEALWIRLLVGGAILAGFVGWDVYRHGRQSRRLREYGFLLFCTAAAMVYGVVNDQVTVTISWEYYHYGKGLFETLGVDQPAESALRWYAVQIGLMATWWVGLILGVTVLLSNRPKPLWSSSPVLPTLPWGRLVRLVLLPLSIAVGFGAIGGVLGYRGLLNGLSSDIASAWADDLWRPARFSAAWGVHLGGYVGGLLGGVVTVFWIFRQRKKLALANKSQTE